MSQAALASRWSSLCSVHPASGRRCVLFLCLALFAAGCSDDSATPAQDGSDEHSERAVSDSNPDNRLDPATGNAGATVERITLETAGPDELRAAIDERRGRVVMVDFWATWCTSCVELFPHTVELHEQLADRGLAVITVSLDDTDARDQVLAFLRRHNATTLNLISPHGAGTKSMDAFELPGPLPQLKFYDRQGQSVGSMPRPGTSLEAEQIDRTIEELLAR